MTEESTAKAPTDTGTTTAAGAVAAGPSPADAAPGRPAPGRPSDVATGRPGEAATGRSEPGTNDPVVESSTKPPLGTGWVVAASLRRDGDAAGAPAGPPDRSPSGTRSVVESSPDRRLGAAVLVAGLVGAVALPVTGVGIGWVVAALAAFGVAVTAYVQARKADAPRPRDPSLQGERAWRAAAGLAALVLVADGAIRSAGWLLSLCLAASLLLASYALTGGRSARDLIAGAFALVPATVRGMGWAADGTRAGPQGQRWLGRVAAGLAAGTVLLLVFGALFRAADPAFADLVARWRGDISVWSLVRGLIGFAFVAGIALGAVQLARTRRVLSARDPLGAPAYPSRSALGLAEWVIPLVMLDVLFGVFVWVQITVLFADDGYVLAPGGPDYAEYARGGSVQLGVVALLTLGVIGAVVLWVRPDSQTRRGLLRVLGGILCGLTLVVVASGLTRLSLYAGAYGFTVPRLLVYAGEIWLGIIFVLLLLAGVRLRASWFPRGVVASAVAVLIALAAANPEAQMARTHIDRLAHDFPVDLYFLSQLSADAVDEIDRLPEPQRSCLLVNLAAELSAPRAWYRWNLAEAHAREILATHHFDKDCVLPFWLAPEPAPTFHST